MVSPTSNRSQEKHKYSSLPRSSTDSNFQGLITEIMLLRTWTPSAFASRNASVELSCLAFPFLLRLTQPPLQHCLGIWRHFQKRHARTHIVLRVDDLRFGLEERLPCRNFHHHQGPVREGIHHVQIAPVPAEFAPSRTSVHLTSPFNT